MLENKIKNPKILKEHSNHKLIAVFKTITFDKFSHLLRYIIWEILYYTIIPSAKNIFMFHNSTLMIESVRKNRPKQKQTQKRRNTQRNKHSPGELTKPFPHTINITIYRI